MRSEVKGSAMASFWRSARKILSEHSLSLALFGLFLICAASQSVSGWFAYNQALQGSQLQTIGFGDYLRTGNLLDGVFSNWQAAILQLAVLVAFSSVLRQKGAAHSRRSPNHRTLKWKFGPRETARKWLYANSLSIALCLMFAACFALHVVFGHRKYNEDQALRHLPAVSLASYAGSASFWSSVFETWEAEFFAIGLFVVLSIFLRQEGSPESKPVNASNDATGETNK